MTEDLKIHKITTVDCEERATVGDTLSIEHSGFVEATQIDGNPEG